MTSIQGILKEVWGLFVDDGLFALSILVVLAVGWVLPRLGLPDLLSTLVFVISLAALLLSNTVSYARNHG